MSKEEFISEMGLKQLKNWLFGTGGAGVVALGAYFGTQFLDHGTKNGEKITKLSIAMEKLTYSLDKTRGIHDVKLEHIEKDINKNADSIKENRDYIINIDKKLDDLIEKS